MDLIKEFELEMSKQDKSNNTISSYINAVKDFTEFMKANTGQFKPSDILEIDIKEYKMYLLNDVKRSPLTVNNKLSGLTSYCDFLVEKGILTSNPVEKIKKVKIQKSNTAPQTLNYSDFYRLRREFYRSNNKRDIVIFELLYNTGLRVSELCNLELDDIVSSDRKGQIIVRYGKGGKYRTIPLNKSSRTALKEYMSVMPLTDNKKLLQGQRGALQRIGVYRIIKKYSKQAGIEDVSPHTLRHQFCKDLLDKGIDIVTVANLAGHSDIKTTAIYTQPTEEQRILAVEKL